MTDLSSNEQYFLDVALDEFINKVWDRGLQKFASDTDNTSDLGTLVFGDLKLAITPGVQPHMRTLSIGTDSDYTTLELSLNMPIIDPECSCVGDIEVITDLIYQAIDIWIAGFFTLKES